MPIHTADHVLVCSRLEILKLAVCPGWCGSVIRESEWVCSIPIKLYLQNTGSKQDLAQPVFDSTFIFLLLNEVNESSDRKCI